MTGSAPQGDSDRLNRLMQALMKMRLDALIKEQFEKPIQYKSVAGDSVDKMIEDVVKAQNIKLPIHRVGPSKYLYGSNLISAKIVNAKLMVRVGGGYMKFEEFHRTHEEKEIQHLEHRMRKEHKDLK